MRGIKQTFKLGRWILGSVLLVLLIILFSMRFILMVFDMIEVSDKASDVRIWIMGLIIAVSLVSIPFFLRIENNRMKAITVFGLLTLILFLTLLCITGGGFTI